MSEYIILTDSSCDLPDELCRELDIEVLPLTVHLDGKSYQEIAQMLGRHVKSIDNALQRVKHKLEKLIEGRNG